MKEKIEKVIVVEGRDDTRNLKHFYDLDTYETGGSSIDATDIERLKVLQEKRGLVVFTDPDFQGERIRKIIMQAIPEAQHAFLKREEARPKGKGSLGVEHAKYEDLKKALGHLTGGENIEPTVTQAELIAFGLILRSDSRQRREYLCEELRIGYANGKQILKRLNMFGIELQQIEEIMKGYK